MSRTSGTKKPVLVVATAHARQQTTPGLDEGYDTIYLAPVTEENIREATEKLSPDAKYAIIGFPPFLVIAIFSATNKGLGS